MRRVGIAFVMFSVAIWVTEYQNQTETTAVVSQPEQVSMNQPESELLPPTGPEIVGGGYQPVAEGEHQFVELFRRCGAEHGVDPALLASVASVESSYRTDAVSHKGAEGLMQFMPNTASAMGIDPWNPGSAICGTARYLKTSIGIHGDWDRAIAAYNAGDGAVARNGASAADGSYVADVQAAWAARRHG